MIGREKENTKITKKFEKTSHIRGYYTEKRKRQ